MAEVVLAWSDGGLLVPGCDFLRVQVSLWCSAGVGDQRVNESYADDFNLAETSPDLCTLGTILTEHLIHISK
jgi:hypothetical protein